MNPFYDNGQSTSSIHSFLAKPTCRPVGDSEGRFARLPVG
jgi:hypothetical protein